jgi:hypothetical protein
MADSHILYALLLIYDVNSVCSVIKTLEVPSILVLGIVMIFINQPFHSDQ